ncbi:MAG: L-threonylcarbamoyladenylate synthase, partial [Thermodesulfobacteriota bacterium]|nr:L-threonylcarbamoyladenylate synthase [Thermodesulfobacteriota bacterium]
MQQRIDNEKNLPAGLNKAVEIIISGGIVAYPTESFYGLAVNISNEKAIQRLFIVKKRRKDNPVLILIPSIEVLDQYVIHVSETARKLMDQFWPGGLTMIFKAGPNISSLLTGNTDKIGVRLSNHPAATALTRAVGVPITGTSANISGRPACLNAGEVYDSLGKDIDFILDGGETKGGSGSTILDVTVMP